MREEETDVYMEMCMQGDSREDERTEERIDRISFSTYG